MAGLAYVAAGLLDTRLLGPLLVAAPAYALGIWGGAHCFGLASEVTFRRACFGMIALGGGAQPAGLGRHPAIGGDRTMGGYSPKEFRALGWHDAAPAFRDGSDTPRAWLERCLETIAAREPVVRAWVVRNEAGARDAADASTARWRDGRPLSPIDGMPIGIKDLLETRDMPTQMGCAGYAGQLPEARQRRGAGRCARPAP